MHKRTLAAAMVAVISACAALGAGGAARADDAPKGGKPSEMKQIPRLEDAFLVGLVGSWDVAMEGFGGKASGVSRVRKVCGDTTLLQETRITMMGRSFFAV